LTILLVPRISETAAATQIEAMNLPPLRFSQLARTASADNSMPLDRQFRTLVCPYDLSSSSIAISAPMGRQLWTLAIFNNESRNVYSLNDRLTASASLELVLVNNAQLARLREIGAQELEKRIVVELESDEGFALFRVFAGSDQQADDIQRFASALQCTIFTPNPGTLRQVTSEEDDNRV
ncbi:MAG: DUF1254 domain-containing protein, partial [Pseudomonadota bacterium]